MKLSEIIRFLDGLNVNPRIIPASTGENDPEIREVFSDSRMVTENSLFCCIRGEKSDGHDYALSAASSGASALLAEKQIPGCEIPQIIVNSTRELMGKIAAKVYGEPAGKLKMYAVTGTNGKTTTTWVIRSLLESLGIKCGMIGTVIQHDGLKESDAERTTPESCDIQRLLSHMVGNGCGACVMETSSHGLDMGRLDGCMFDVMVFNNLNPEHLDYHKTMDNYFAAKCILFDKYSKSGGKIIVNADDAYGKRIIEKYGRSFKLCSFAIDERKADYCARNLELGINGSKFELFIGGGKKFAGEFISPLVAAFNVRNTLGALAAVHGDGTDMKLLVKGVADTPQVPGRLEKHFIPIGGDSRAACCIIDFAHTPEALKNVLSAVREFCDGDIISVFGHGGGRYQANRPALGAVAAELADKLIITMDNPRNESPIDIADQIAAGVIAAKPDMDMKIIIDRKKAINEALDGVKPGDVVVLTGKGPEKYLIIGDNYLPYSDTNEVRSRLLYKKYEYVLGLSLGGPGGTPPEKGAGATPLLLDSREVKAAAGSGVCGFVAIAGEKVDGHSFIKQAIADGAKFIIGKRSGKPADFPEDIPYLELEDTERELALIAKKHIENTTPKEIIAITGSVGKTTAREAVKRVLEKKYRVHSAERSFNTLIGCAVSILSMPADTEILLLEFGANKPGEIRELTGLFSPTISVITEVAPVHLEGFKTIEGVLREKMEITLSDRLKTFIYNADNEILRRTSSSLRQTSSTQLNGLNSLRALSVGRTEKAEYLIKDFPEKISLPVKWELAHNGRSQVFSGEFWGRHPILALSIAAAIGNELGVSGDQIREAVSEYRPLNGRGRIIYGSNGKILIDDAYNANPASMSASLSSFLELDARGEKWAILGDMRELGEDGPNFHREISELFSGIDKVLLVGKIWEDTGVIGLPNCFYFDGWRSAYKFISENIRWSAMLVKGSNSHRLQELVAEVESELNK